MHVVVLKNFPPFFTQWHVLTLLHPISFCWPTYWAPVELLWESFLSHVTWLCYCLHELWWADLIHPLNVLMHSSVGEFCFSMWFDVLLFPSMNWGQWGWLNPSSECIVVAFSVNMQVDWFLGKFFLLSSTLYCLDARLLTSVSLQTSVVLAAQYILAMTGRISHSW